MSIDAMKQALEVLEGLRDLFYQDTIEALRAAIEAAEKVAPVAWIHPMDIGRFGSVTFNRDSEEQIPLYAHPPHAIPEWQPIETAPRDGTRILALTWHDNAYVVSYDDSFSAPWRIFNDQGLNERAVLYWMPLPAAPKPENSHE